MSKTLNTVIHFQGSELTWKNNIVNGVWADDIVFGLIIDTNTGITSKRFYAGRNSRNTDYEYKTSVSVNSLAEANTLVLDDNVGLLITVVSELNPNENGTYIVTYNQENILDLQKIGEQPIPVDASTMYTLIDSSNKIDTEDPSTLEAIDRSAEGVKVKITEAEDSQTLKFGIDLDKIYLPHGIQRTEAIGVFPASDEIVTDGVGMSVKELLEYYLLKEKFPEPIFARGSGSFTNFGLTVSGLPQSNVKSYVRINGEAAPSNNALVEIGSEVSIAKINGELICSRYGMQDSVTSTASVILNLNFGYCTELGAPISSEVNHYEPAGEISSNTLIKGETETATAIYTIKDADLNVTGILEFQDSSVSSISNESNYNISEQHLYVIEGNNNIKLSLNHNASAIRILENTQIPGISQVYVLSNKKHASTDNIASMSAGNITGTLTGSVNTYTTSKYNVIGVYPIFTNGKVVPENANLSAFNWYQNTYSTQPVNKLELSNYLNSNQIYIITFGATNDANRRKCYIYVPHNLTFTVPLQCQIDSNENITSWKENTMRNISWLKEGTTNINIQGNEVEYDIYTENTNGAGNWAFKVQINKK